MNKIIKILITSNSFVNAADGFLAPVFAIFIISKIAPGQIKIAGIALAIYWLVKSVIQLPLSRYLNKHQGEKDDLGALIFGSFLFSIVPLFYIFVFKPWQLFLVQGLMALAGALYVIPWYSIFTRHVDKFRIGFEWSINSGALGIGIVITTFSAGFLADEFGFNIVFILASIFYFIATFLNIFLYKFLIKRDKLKKVFPERRHIR